MSVQAESACILTSVAMTKPGEKGRSQDPKFDEIPPVPFEVAKRYFNQVAPDKTAMGATMLADIIEEIDRETVSDMTQLDCFFRKSKTRTLAGCSASHIEAWAFRATTAAQQKDLIKYLRDGEDLLEEDWLIYKVRQELHEYQIFHGGIRGGLKLYFDKLERGVRKNPAIDKHLAGAIHAEFFQADCTLNKLDDVEALIMREYQKPVSLDLKQNPNISQIKVHCRNAVEWKPETMDEMKKLLKLQLHIGGADHGVMEMDTKKNPGFFMKLKLKADFSNFVKEYLGPQK